MKKVFLASDHAGFELKQTLAAFLALRGYDIDDVGPHTHDASDDYPDFVMPLAQKVAQNNGSFGIVIGLSGQGEAMAANRVRGARAAVFYGGSEELLRLSREHNDANILSLGARFVPEEDAKRVVLEWLETAFTGEDRHLRRIAKLDHV